MANNYDLSDLAIPTQPDQPNFDLSDLTEPEVPEPQEPSMLQKAGALGKGAVAGAIGAIPDTLTMPYNLIQQLYGAAKEHFPQAAQYAPMALVLEAQRKVFGEQIPSATQAIEKGISKLTGETPEEVKHLEKGAEFAGSLLGPGAMAKGVGRLGQAALQKGLAAIGTTKPSELLGAGVAGTAMSKLQEEGYGLPASIVGSLTASGLTQNIINGTKRLTKDAIPRILSIGAKPREEIIQTAKKYGIDLPANVQLNSKLTSFLNNSYLKSVFSAKQYQDSIKNADQKMIDTVVNKINSVNPEIMERESASKIYREALSEEAIQTEKKADELYNAAREKLNPEDRVKPSHTLNALNELKSKLSASVPSADMKFMLSKISDLEKAWNLKIKKPLMTIKEPTENLEKYISKILPMHNEVPLDSLIQQRSAFMRDIKYGEEARGAKGFMNFLISAIDKDISSATNQDFVKTWREANKFYKNEIADRIRSDFAQSLSKNEIPKEAYSYMSSPQHIQELERMLGTSPATKQVMNALKRSKLQEVVMDRVKNADGSISYANLANMFNKKSTQQGMLKSLLGNENYKELSELAQIGAGYTGAGKSFANPSGSALTKQDFDKIGNFMTLAITAGTAGIANPYFISKAVSNPKYIEKAVKYAQARAHKDIQQMNKYQREMKQIYLKNILPQIREAQSSSED